jgi:hypothetical protein
MESVRIEGAFPPEKKDYISYNYPVHNTSGDYQGPQCVGDGVMAALFENL